MAKLKNICFYPQLSDEMFESIFDNINSNISFSYTINDKINIVNFTDKNGIYKPTIKENIKNDKIINGELLGFGNGCSYSEKGYITNECETFYGEAVAVIKPTSSNDVIIEASSKYGKTISIIKGC